MDKNSPRPRSTVSSKEESGIVKVAGNEITMRFKPGKIGLVASKEGGQVTTVTRSGQAEEMGVMPGWRIRTVDGFAYSQSKLLETLSGTQNYQLTFDTKEVFPLLQMRFKPGKIGLVVNASTGEVQKVTAREQADDMGVNAGWRIRAVEGAAYSKKRLDAALSGSSFY